MGPRSGGNSAQRETASGVHLCPQQNLPDWWGQEGAGRQESPQGKALHGLGFRRALLLEAPESARAEELVCSREALKAATT